MNDDKDNLVVVNGWIVCSCGKKHRLIPAINTPVYWCGNELLKLKEGDDIEYGYCPLGLHPDCLNCRFDGFCDKELG